MKRMRWPLLLLLLTAGLLVAAPHLADAATLKDADGINIVPGTSTPYSPKQTCGNCHIGGRPYDKWTVLWNSQALTGTGRYEMDIDTAIKSHSGETYAVPYPRHGISAGYHFQQGRNVSLGNTQRDYYGLAAFTSSPGMYGKY